ncbi:IclR family transcriptional regulator [Thermus scotoductus]|uniref:IclR family transcriptional regulator n=2 Tax=Thermus scotoductus TaxID=37636 RepID=A0A430UI20_THESC|nr:IclR family transcriptional regulator [Thermus scotoductus]
MSRSKMIFCHLKNNPAGASLRSMPRPRRKGAEEVKTLERGLSVLQALAELKEAGLSPLAERTGLTKSTLYRLLQTLVRHGFVEEERGVYRVGPKAFAVGQVYPRQNLLLAAHPEMEALAAETGESVNLAVLAGREALYLDQAEGARLVRLFTAPGSRAPLHATGVGKVLLAFRGIPEGLSLTPYTPYTLTRLEDLKRELETVRRKGYALDNEERELGVRCVAAPVFGPGGEVVAALSLSAPASRLSLEEAHRLAPRVMEAARKASLRLGFVPAL